MTTMREFFVNGMLRRHFPHLQKRLALADAYSQVFGLPAGQVVLRDLIREGGVLSVAADPDDSRFYDGKRALALHVLDRLRWSASELQALGQEITYEQVMEREAREAA
jgi:hypothetical protein